MGGYTTSVFPEVPKTGDLTKSVDYINVPKSAGDFMFIYTKKAGI
jgi:hypothetical protein